MSIPVRIKSVQYETLGPIVNYIHPVTITQYKTFCTIFLDRGVTEPPVSEGLTGQTEQDQVVGVYVETDSHDSVYAQSQAYNEALNVISSYGFTVVDSTPGNLGY